MLLARVGVDVRRDPVTGLYVIDATVPETVLTLPEYEAGRKVLDLRAKAART